MTQKQKLEWQVTFAMVQTLSLDANINTMPPIDLLVIDEAHHAAANTYRIIIEKALQLNPNCIVFGVTATLIGVMEKV